MPYLITAGVLLLLVLLIGALLAAYLVYHPTSPDFQKTLEIETEKGLAEGYDPTASVCYTVPSFDGYVLHAELLQAPQKTNRYVILSHGYSYDRHGSLKYAKLFRSLGFHCVIYDNRGHGLNKKAACTFGIKESRDLCAMIDDCYTRYGQDIVLGLHGESMGSALGTIALQYKPRVRFSVHDCGYADFFSVIRLQMKTNHIPSFLIYPTELMCRLLFHVSIRKARPIDCVSDNEIPLCFFHGTADKMTPYSHSERLAAANGGPCELHLFPGATHAGCLIADEDQYKKILTAFLESVGVKPEESI